MSLAKKLLFFTASLVVFCTGHAQERTEDFSGLWQFPNRTVWIDIRQNGTAFQCRIDTDHKTTYISSGKIISDTIEWQEIWGAEKISREGRFLVVNGKFGKYSYIPAISPISAICQSPLPTLSLKPPR